jgi:hypothetical protein
MLRSGTVISLHELYATGKSIREIGLSQASVGTFFGIMSHT